MKDGVRWTLIGGLVGVVLLVLATVIYHSFIKMLPPSKFNWGLALSLALPIYTGVLVWGVKFFDQKNKNEVIHIFQEIDKKADKTKVDEHVALLRQALEDHKEINNHQFDSINKFMASIDSKLELLLNKE